ncbi:hypothetical protein BaRGS_00038794, partial [Batillaria attramentaria]
GGMVKCQAPTPCEGESCLPLTSLVRVSLPGASESQNTDNTHGQLYSKTPSVSTACDKKGETAIVHVHSGRLSDDTLIVYFASAWGISHFTRR